MNNKVIFFSVDRLGDYLIRSNVMKQISDKFKFSEIVCSEKNYNLISSQSFFSKILLLNKSNFINKIKFFFIFFFRKYDACIVFDGKNISTILSIITRSKFKFIFLHKKKGITNNIILKSKLLLFRLLKIEYEIIYNRELIEDNNYESYPVKYKILNKYFSNLDNNTYYLEESIFNDYDYLNSKFILIHLDEKFNDIKNIDFGFEDVLINFQKTINRNIILSSFKNNYKYYKNLNFQKISINYKKDKKLQLPKISLIEDLPLANFQNLIKNSYLNISCHSGYFVHTSLTLNKKTIDIINKSDEIWLNTWIEKNNNYKIIYKSSINNDIDIKRIFNELTNEIK